MANFKTSAESDTRSIFENGILSRNPVLVYAIGICPLIAVAKSAATASVLAILSAILLIVSEVLTSLFIKKMPKWLRVGVYALLGVLIIIPFYMLMGIYMPSVEVSLGIYIPLLAVNSLTVQRCEACAVKHSIKFSFLDAVANSIGYAIPLILTGIIREALGSSRIFGYYIDALPRANGFLMPFCGFIILGFVAAFINYLRNKFRIGKEFDAKSNDFVVDKQNDKAIYSEEDEDSIQNEITVVPEATDISTSAAKIPDVSNAMQEEEASASFESSVNRIMHKWSPADDSEISEETDAAETTEKPEETAKTQVDKKVKEESEKAIKAETQRTEHPNTAIPAADSETTVKSAWHIVTESSAATFTEHADTAQAVAETIEAAPAPKKVTRKRTTKKAAETAAESTDSPKADTGAAPAQSETIAAAEAAEAPATKKTTRKRTTKKAAETAAVTADSPKADTDTAPAQPEAIAAAETAEAPAPKKATRKRTASKSAEKIGQAQDTPEEV